MNSCKHNKIVLLPKNKIKVRCCKCHLTINADELKNGFCPECFEVKGIKNYDFEEIKKVEVTKYKCEQCGMIIEC